MSHSGAEAALRAGSICRCRGLPAETTGYVVVAAEPVRGREWLSVVPLGQPPAVKPHPLRPHLPLAAVQRLVPAEHWPGCFTQPPLLVGDRITSAWRGELAPPIGQISREQLLRVRQLGALALGLNPSDLREGVARSRI
jgi:hypothetical protein